MAGHGSMPTSPGSWNGHSGDISASACTIPGPLPIPGGSQLEQHGVGACVPSRGADCYWTRCTGDLDG